jgi:hypothetical protein
MAVHAVIDKLADVPEDLRDDYIARSDGKWELTLDGVPSGFVRLLVAEGKSKRSHAGAGTSGGSGQTVKCSTSVRPVVEPAA